jgi:hypothetical protein
MRSARFVSDKWFVQEHGFLHGAYDAPIDWFAITSPNLAFCPAAALRRPPVAARDDRARPGLDIRRWSHWKKAWAD